MRELLVLTFSCAMALNAGAGQSLAVGKIIVDTLDVYSDQEAGEGSFYRLADTMHVETRESVIRRYLLFAEGEPFRPERLAETERNLRTLSFLKSASVTAGEPHDGVVDIYVTTQDSWSLSPETQLNSKGGEATYGVSIAESNLLGYGKEMSINWDKMIDRNRYGIDFLDPNVANYWTTYLSYGSTSDGHDQRLLLRRPFYSFATPWAADMLFESFQQHDRLYAQGLELTQFDHEHRQTLLSHGRAIGPNDRHANRISAGLRILKDSFNHLETAASEHLPDDRDYRYVFVRYEHAQNDFVKLNFVNRDLRYEDFNLGAQYSIEAGLSPRAFGAPANSSEVRVTAATGQRFGERSFLMPSIALETRLDGGIQNGIATSAVYYVRRGGSEKPSTFVARAAFQAGWRLDQEVQFFADGLTGLRGYRLHSYAGSRAIVLNAEHRFHLGREVLQIYSPGFAVFADAGHATYGGFRDLMHMKVDVGVGIRLGLPRTPRKIVRIDLAYALQRDPQGKRGLLISFSSGQAF